MGEIKLFTNGTVKTKDGKREFTRLLGGFGDNKPMFTLWQAGELLGLTPREIAQNFSRNESKFENNIDFIDLKLATKNRDKVVNTLKNSGYSQNKLNATKRWLVFSLNGLSKLIYISDKLLTNIDIEFLKTYFKADNIHIKLYRSEIIFKDMLLSTFKNIVYFIPQYSCCNNKYRIDFYCSEFKLAIEYDEDHHNYHISEDKIRQKEIQNELGCKFIRVKKGQELLGINQILKYIMNVNNVLLENKITA